MKIITERERTELREFARLLDEQGGSREAVLLQIALRLQCPFHSHGRAEFRCLPGTPGLAACHRRLTIAELVLS